MNKSWDSIVFLYESPMEGETETSPAKETPEPSDNGDSKTFNQDQVNKIVEERLSRYKKQVEPQLGKLTEMEKRLQMSDAQRNELQTTISELETTFMTKEEQLLKEKNILEKQHKDNLVKFEKERDTWRERFTDSTIKRALTDAAVSADAENPAQIVAMFAANSKLVEEMDEAGKTLGKFTPMVDFIGLNEQKEQQIFTMPVDKAIKKIKEDGLNANLFKHRATPGTGTSPGSGSGGSSGNEGRMPQREDFKSTADYTAAYVEWRDSYNPDGTKKRGKRENN